MLASRKVKKITGELDVTVTGLSPEKLLNIAYKNQIKLSDIRRLSYTQLVFSIGPSDYIRLKSLLPEGRYRLAVRRSRGVSLLIYTFRNRYCLIAGIILSLILTFVISGRIWFVKIRGCEEVDQGNIERLLESYGLKAGTNVSGEQLDKMEKQLLRDMPELSWVGISRRGVNIYAYVKEKTGPPESTPINEPADITAMKDGVIEKVTVLQGRAVVTQGQTVKKGDVLISGQLIYQELPYQYIYALGKVQARVWYSEECIISLTQNQTMRTGNTAIVRSMKIFGREIHLDGENPFLNYQTETTEKDIMNLGIPVTIITNTYYETEEQKHTLTQQEALELGKHKLREQLLSQIPADAERLREEARLKIAEGENTVTVSMFIETLEQIGQTKKIIG